MADAPKHPHAHSDKPAGSIIKKRTGHSLLRHRTLDGVKPSSQAQPSATARPVITGNTPVHADATVKPADVPAPSLVRHHNHIQPLTPGLAPAAPAEPSPSLAAGKPSETPAPAAAAPAPAPAPAVASRPASPAVPPPIPDVSAPPAIAPAYASHEADELALANLPGIHGIVEKAPVDPAVSVSAEPAATAPPTTQMHQTPEQAHKLALALNDLRHHPAPAVDDRPVVVVHEHEYLHTALVFIGFLLGGALLFAIVFDLALDAGVIDLPVQPLTHFFKH